MTIAGRKALDYALRQEENGEKIILGEMMRVCGFSCRSNAKRTLLRLKKNGMLPIN